ncbi:MAG: class I SAM-dependent methyltransferase [Planctomycetes bacterium]|nr:class I SAM-dependent methyltransferase [Planctomycetota bacterium]
MTDGEHTAGFGASWDRYVEDAKAAGQAWPGDDWGDETLWRAWFDRLFVGFGVDGWQRAVEIGQGTGKYTKFVLDAGRAELLACDVSQRFLDLCGERLVDDVAAGRLKLTKIAEDDPASVRDVAERIGWLGSVDAVYSIDSLVHVPFTFFASYLLQATEILKPGGRFIATFAHGLTDAGQRKLIADVGRVVRAGGRPETGCFHWIAPELLERTAATIGFRVEICDADPLHGRDGHFVATFEDPQAAKSARDAAR